VFFLAFVVQKVARWRTVLFHFKQACVELSGLRDFFRELFAPSATAEPGKQCSVFAWSVSFCGGFHDSDRLRSERWTT
jgi:hypothetical protein